jgi:hypothetical protein
MRRRRGQSAIDNQQSAMRLVGETSTRAEPATVLPGLTSRAGAPLPRRYFWTDFFVQACFLSSPWHLRICAGVQSPILPFRFHGFWHTGFLVGMVLLLS